MNERTLFVFGNGFDLAHELETHYSDYLYFIEVLRIWAKDETDWKTKAQSYTFKTSKIYQYLSENLSAESHPHYLDTIIHTLYFDSSLEKVNDKENPWLENPWHTYLMNQLQNNIEHSTWIDFEIEIKKLICKLDSSSDAQNDSTAVSKNYLSLLEEEMKIPFASFPQDIIDLSAAIEKQKSAAWSSNDRSNFKISILPLKEKVSLLLYKELLRYAFCFELYLRYYVLSSECMDRQTFFETLFHRSDSNKQFLNTFILNFNYTDTAEQLYPTYSENLHHIHGSIRTTADFEQEINLPNGNTMLKMDDPAFQMSTPIILGFQPDPSNNDTYTSPFIWFEKFYQRIIHHTGIDIYDWLSYIQFNSNKSGASILHAVFYGHSLDVSDGDFIRKIFEVSTKFDVYYHEDAKLPQLVSNLIKSLGKHVVEESCANDKLHFIPMTTMKYTFASSSVQQKIIQQEKKQEEELNEALGLF